MSALHYIYRHVLELVYLYNTYPDRRFLFREAKDKLSKLTSNKRAYAKKGMDTFVFVCVLNIINYYYSLQLFSFEGKPGKFMTEG